MSKNKIGGLKKGKAPDRRNGCPEFFYLGRFFGQGSWDNVDEFGVGEIKRDWCGADGVNAGRRQKAEWAEEFVCRRQRH